MTRIFSYYGALDIGSVLLSRRDLGEFVEYMIGRLNEMIMENRDDDCVNRSIRTPISVDIRTVV